MNSTKNRVVLTVDVELHLVKKFWEELWAVLPEDTEIVEARTDHTATHLGGSTFADVSSIVIVKLASEKFPLTKAYGMLPDLIPHFSGDNTLKKIEIDGVVPIWFKFPGAFPKLPDTHFVGQPNAVRAPVSGNYMGPNGQTKQFDMAELINAMAKCICDMAYTGLKTHRKDCPCLK